MIIESEKYMRPATRVECLVVIYVDGLPRILGCFLASSGQSKILNSIPGTHALGTIIGCSVDCCT